MPRRVTLSDVASRAKLHKSTVSLALRDSRLIAERTRERVKALALEMGYVPDPALSRIAAHRWKQEEIRRYDTGCSLAFIDFKNWNDAANPRSLLEFVRDEAKDHGYGVDHFSAKDYPDPKVFRRILETRGIRGLLLRGVPPHLDWRNLLDDWSGFCPVQLGSGGMRSLCYTVEYDWFFATSVVWQQAVARGYRRIGACLFCHSQRHEEDLARIGAALIQQHENTPSDLVPPFTGGFREKDGFLEWYAEYRPDAVIGGLATAHRWLLDEGGKIPEEVGFAAIKTGSNTPRSVSGLRPHEHLKASAAVELLKDLLHRNKLGIPDNPRTILIEPEWKEGTTLPDRAKRKTRRRRSQVRRGLKWTDAVS